MRSDACARRPTGGAGRRGAGAAGRDTRPVAPPPRHSAGPTLTGRMLPSRISVQIHDNLKKKEIMHSNNIP